MGPPTQPALDALVARLRDLTPSELTRVAAEIDALIEAGRWTAPDNVLDALEAELAAEDDTTGGDDLVGHEDVVRRLVVR